MTARVSPSIQARAGVGLKNTHISEILETRPEIGWFEIHAENYMGDGGRPHHDLERIRADWPISLHGIGLSIGADRPLDRDHLARLKSLIERYQPGLFSEHLAWSTHDDVFVNDLLPVPYNRESLDRVCEHIDQVQETVGCKLLLENPSTYVTFETSTIGELDFLKRISQRTGCGLLLDVNNVFVSATNHGWSAETYIDSFPLDRVGEIHLAGHAPDTDDEGSPLLIDAHDRPVADPVWTLYRRVIERVGPLPSLVEWDNDVPVWSTLFAEAKAADAVMASIADSPDRIHVASR